MGTASEARPSQIDEEESAGPPALPGEVTRILNAWSDGDPEALDQLIVLVVDDLTRIARNCMQKERGEHTLEPSALVNELYLRLTGQRKTTWANRLQFFSFAAQMMRKILIDHARRRDTDKRGQGYAKLPIDEALGVPDGDDVDLERLDGALNDLAKLDPRQARIVELRFFVGLSVAEIETIMGCSRATVIRDWRTARLWLMQYMEAA